MTGLRQRQPREECPGYLAAIRKLPCCACHAAAPSEAAHIRMGNITRGKRPTGMAEKPDDKWAVPLCAGCHRTDDESQHSIGEEHFWRGWGRNPFQLAERFYAVYLLGGGKPGAVPTPRKKKKANPTRKAPIKSRGFPKGGPKQKIQSRGFK